MASNTEFVMFPLFPLEIRSRIWSHTLPDTRILHVTAQFHPDDSFEKGSMPYYTTSKYSKGLLPICLRVCRESRREALRHLTPMFGTYWNLKSDILYIEEPPWRNDEAAKQLKDMNERGLLDDVKNLALDWNIWNSKLPQHCTETVSHLGGLKNLIFIYRANQNKTDIVRKGSIWYPVPLSPKQKEFQTIDCAVVHSVILEQVYQSFHNPELEWQTSNALPPKVLVRGIGGRTLTNIVSPQFSMLAMQFGSIVSFAEGSKT